MTGMPDFTISRSVHVDADSATVHALVDDFHEWVHWSPWEGTDPDLQRTYTGPSRGVGSSYAWKGNRAGEGTMTITGSSPEHVALDLSFVKPFTAHNQVRLTFEPVAAGGTEVTWTMHGTRGRVAALSMRLIKMDDRLAKDFDRGLASLRERAESR